MFPFFSFRPKGEILLHNDMNNLRFLAFARNDNLPITNLAITAQPREVGELKSLPINFLTFRFKMTSLNQVEFSRSFT